MRQPPLNQDIFIIVRQNTPMSVSPLSMRKKWPLFYSVTPSVFTSYDAAFNVVKRARRRMSDLDQLEFGPFNIIRIPKD